MFGGFWPPDLANRERRWRRSWYAMSRLGCFGIGTILGYLIWHMILWQLSPEILTFNTFLWLFLIGGLTRYGRSLMAAWHPLTLPYVFRVAAAQSVYWVTFWFGLAHSGSASLALAFLALTMLVSPLMVWQLETRDERSAVFNIIALGLLLVLSVIAIKLDINYQQLTWANVGLIFSDPVSAGLFIVAVIAESFGDRTMYALNAKLAATKEREKVEVIRGVPRGHTQQSLEGIIGQAVTAQAILICLVLAVLLLIVSKFTSASAHQIGVVQFLHFPAGSWAWFVVWLLALGLVGSAAKIIFVLPLQLRKLDPYYAVPPLMAGRQIIYLALAYILVALVPHIARCNGLSCDIFSQHINLDILPEGKESYCIGIVIVVIIWLASWARLSVVGFFKQQIKP